MNIKASAIGLIVTALLSSAMVANAAPASKVAAKTSVQMKHIKHAKPAARVTRNSKRVARKGAKTTRVNKVRHASKTRRVSKIRHNAK